MTLLDKVIAEISPQTALKRIQARRQLEFLNYGTGYARHGASHAKKSLTSWTTGGSDADSDIVDNIKTLRDRSRDLYMGAPIATGAIKTVRTNVIGSGLALNAQIDAKYLKMTDEQARAWEENTEREWRLWAESVNCDAERRQTFYQLQSLVLLSALMSGDVFVTLPMIKRSGSPYDLCISLIEADRVCNPDNLLPQSNANILGGVEIGQYGEAIAYWIAKYNPNSCPRSMIGVQNEWKRVYAFGQKTGRRNVLHIMADVERPAQRRGVPMLAPVIESLKQLGRYTEAELMAAVISGMFTVFVKTPNPQEGGFAGGGGFAPGGGFTPGGQEKKERNPDDYAMGNGATVFMDPNEDISIANPGRPNTAFDGFVSAICRQLGAATELGHELLMKEFTASYSASRAALLEAWKMFRMRREWMIGNFCQPVYEEWLTEAILKGRIQAPGYFEDPAIRAAWCGADWYGDSQGQLDPLKEANAAKVRVEEGFSTREREAAELTGMKYEAIHATRKREEEMRKADGLTPGGMVQTAPAPADNGGEDDGTDADE